MYLGILATILSALSFISLPVGHIELAIPSMLYIIFIQAFTMFYFIGVNRLVENVHGILHSGANENLKELFDNPPGDLTEYIKKVNRFHYLTKLAKRQTIPWTALILVLGSIGFLLGGAHHTGLVDKTVHSGVIYGFFVAVTIGFIKQWSYLGKDHKVLKEIKDLFQIPHHQM